MNGSMGFQDMALFARPKVIFESGEEVRKSWRTMDLSVAHDPRMLVSVWFKLRAFIVSVELGQFKVCTGVEEEREIS